MIGLGRGVFFGSMFLFGLLGLALKCVSIRIRKGGDRSGEKERHGSGREVKGEGKQGKKVDRVLTWIGRRSRQF